MQEYKIKIVGTPKNPRDFCIKDESEELYFMISEGTGDNLWQEDIDEGYIDYIYYEVSDEEYGSEIDGGMILLKKDYFDYTTEEIIERVLSVYGYEYTNDTYRILED